MCERQGDVWVLLLVSVTNDDSCRLWEVEPSAEIMCPPGIFRFSFSWAEQILRNLLVILNMQN